ncbi:hypothetical protein HMH01_05610 [Halovulum dunhuangense]|uniref:Uncharacterized protein n=1 Tax=Halovulum dunhuangense TaxID=1505036 RepID=A0A849L0V8_9RHOB|nr:hypothetical protein [Halovulum dunhuangense]NNU79912.1 hypothetical protein [Halovulum dunhuangense]
MTAENHATARIREVPLGVQFFTFFVLSQALKYFALMSPVPAEGISVRNLGLIALCFLPFAVARIPFLMPFLPGVALRDDAQVALHRGGLVYTFDGVKRPLFVEWPDLERIERTRFGLILTVRHRANVTEGMPKYQAEFWRAKIRRPIRLIHADRFTPQAGLVRCLSEARRAGVDVRGFEPASRHSHQGSMAAISSSDQPK